MPTTGYLCVCVFLCKGGHLVVISIASRSAALNMNILPTPGCPWMYKPLQSFFRNCCCTCNNTSMAHPGQNSETFSPIDFLRQSIANLTMQFLKHPVILWVFQNKTITDFECRCASSPYIRPETEREFSKLTIKMDVLVLFRNYLRTCVWFSLNINCTFKPVETLTYIT